MDRRQLAITITAVALALVLGVGITLLATANTGDDEREAATPSGSSTTASAPAAPTTTTSGPRLVPIPNPGTVTPGSTVIIPPTSTTPTTTARTAPTTKVPPTVAPQASTPATDAPTTTQPRPPVTTTVPTAPSTTTTEPQRSTDTGVSATQIRVAVIADDPATFEGAEAWAGAVNRRGGIASRKVRLDLLTTDGTPESYDAAVATGCDRAFAIVASLSVGDGTTTALQCGIPDVPVEASTGLHAENATTYAAFPRRPLTQAVGPYAWFANEVPECCAQFVLVPAEGPDRSSTQAAINGAAAVGFDTVGTPDVAADASESDYDALAQDLLASGASFGASGLGAESTLELRRAAARAGATEILAWYCDARCYTTDVATDDDADEQYVAIETVPFSDRGDVPGLRAYLRATVRADRPATYAGLRAYVAGLLFEQALSEVIGTHGDNGITRARLLETLATINAFTADGIVGPTDVAGRQPNGCFVLLQLRGGRFTRVEPGERGSLNCGAQNLVDVEGD